MGTDTARNARNARGSRRLALAAGWMALALTGVLPVPAQTTITWTGAAGDRDWANPANWDTGTVPWDPNPIVFTGTVPGPDHCSTGESKGRSLTMLAPMAIPMDITWIGWDGGLVHAAGGPGDYLIGKVGACKNFTVENGCVLTATFTYKPKCLRGPGMIVFKSGGGDMQLTMAGTTLDLRNADQTARKNDGILGNTAWGDYFRGAGTIASAASAIDNVWIHSPPPARRDWAFTGRMDNVMLVLDSDDAADAVHDFTGILIEEHTLSNKYQSVNNTVHGDDDWFFLRTGANASYATILKGAVLTGRGGNVLSADAMGRYMNWNYSRYSPARVFGCDGVRLAMKHLAVEGDLDFRGEVSTLVVDITGAGGVAGTDHSDLVVRRLQDNGGVSDVNGGHLSGLDRLALAVRLAPGVDVRGQTLVIVSNAASLAGQSPAGVTWHGCSGRVNCNADGTVTLTRICPGSLAGTSFLIR
jgi:hypothetical protein